MKKRYLFLTTLLIMSILVACTPETTDPDNDTGKQEPVLTETIPKDFPEDLVPLYAVDKVEGVITVGRDYHVYYFSNKDKKEIFDHYTEVFKDEDISPYENEFAYELRGSLDDFTLKMHILPSSEEGYETTVILFLFEKDA